MASFWLRFFSAASSPDDPARPKSVSSPRKAMLPALPSLSSQLISASSMLASVGFTLKVHLLPPTPDFSAIDVAEALATMNGTPARSTRGMIANAAELHSPSKMAAYFFSASIWVTLFTASAGLQRLSWKSISILRPSAPPFALASAMASSAPQRACWPKCATPPVSGVDAPMMIGPVGAWANAVEAKTAKAVAVIVTRMLSMLILSASCIVLRILPQGPCVVRAPDRLTRDARARNRALAISQYIADLGARDRDMVKVLVEPDSSGTHFVFRHYLESHIIRLHGMHSCRQHIICPLCAKSDRLPRSITTLSLAMAEVQWPSIARLPAVAAHANAKKVSPLPFRR